MAKETKLGLIVVATLLVVFGVLLVRRVLKSPDGTGAATVAEAAATSPANDSVVISAVSGKEAPSSKSSNSDDPLTHPAHRRWPLSHNRHQHQHYSDDAGQSTAGQAFLPPTGVVSASGDLATPHPALGKHDHRDYAVQAFEQQPAEYQFAQHTAPTARIEQTAVQASTGGNGQQGQQPRYPAIEPQPIHESNYRHDTIRLQQPPSYRDESEQPSPHYRQSAQQADLTANQRRVSEFNDAAAQMHPQVVEHARHRQQHAHPTNNQHQLVGQFGGHHHDQHLQTPPQSSVGGVYVVRPNDNFWAISETLYGRGDYFKALIEYNREQHPLPARLSVGDEVLAPPLPELVEKYPDLCPKQRGQATAIAVASGTVGRPGREYVIREGDTLFDIARYEMGNGSRWVEIYNLNKQMMTEDFDYLKPGTRIALPARVRGPIDRTAQQPDPVRLR